MYRHVVALLEAFFYGLGAFLAWLTKGCKTSLVDELSEEHKKRNIVIATLLWLFFIAAAIYINNS